MKIILIDDTIRHRRAGKQQLTALGHEVKSFGTYSEARHVVESGETFEVALIDLNMPAELDSWGAGFPKEYLGQAVAVGYPLALSLSLLGIPLVALSSDGGHHANPYNAMLDWLKGKPLEVNGRKIIFLEAVMTQNNAGESVKDWSAVLEKILNH
jgi:CheY-like chemotaxis protein